MIRSLPLLLVSSCHWAGWSYYDPGTKEGAGNDSAWGAGLGGGAVCAEWAYQRGDPPAVQVQPDAGQGHHWVSVPDAPSVSLLTVADGGYP